MQKWEYCAVKGITTTADRGLQRKLQTDFPAIWYFTTDGVRVVEIKGGVNIEAPEVAKAIARLGIEGWEMVGGEYLMCFKRPIPESTTDTEGSES